MAVGFFPALCSLVGFLYPSYASFKAIESPDGDDDRQWLTYWVIYAAVGVWEMVFPVRWIPFYYEMKLLGLLWLLAPATNGAKTLYNEFLRPLLQQHASKIDPVFNAGTMALKLPVTGAMAKAVEARGPGAIKALSNAVFNSAAGVQLARLAEVDPKRVEAVLQQVLAATGGAGGTSAGAGPTGPAAPAAPAVAGAPAGVHRQPY